MPVLLSRFWRCESGATAIEYGVIASLISISIIGGAFLIGNEVGNMYNDIGSEMANANK
ncbi:MAG: Flp family type IVb pilin [Alphaproteobacteria bacterium]|nr:Flp family type IVb pilin [Alphaproteobacteria bacterium]